MKRPGRIVLRVALGLSWTACVVAGVQVVRSQFIRDMMGVSVGGRTAWVSSGGGLLTCGVSGERPEWSDCGWVSIDNRGGRSRQGRIAASITREGLRLELPYWLIALGCAVPGVVSIVVGLIGARRRRHREDCVHWRVCPDCGYDLRATPERCPECGGDVSIGDRDG